MQIIAKTSLFLVIVTGMFAAGCGNQTTPEDDSTPRAPDQTTITYDGPPIMLDVTSDDSGTTMTWTVEVPSGGWEAKFARATSAGKQGDWINIYVDLISPGPDEMVTQALETIGDSYTYPIVNPTVRLYVRQVVRGAGAGNDEDYALAVVKSP